ncbi:MAG: alkaline phosphatase family protein, partial [Parvibaculum sp.]
MSDKLNILFITADQWRGDCLSTLDHPTVKTPHLDALAADGVLFKRHYANAVPCAPSRASLHTGLYLQNHRACTNGTPLDARHTNWALEARKQGYDPVLIGYTDTANDPRALQGDSPWLKTYEGPLPGIRPLAMMGTWPGPWADFLTDKGYPLPDDLRQTYGLREDGPDYEHGRARPKPLIYPIKDNDTTYQVEKCMEFMGEAQDPFIMHLSLLRPHPPWVASEPYASMYDPAALPGYIRASDADAEGAQHPWLEHQLANRLYRAPENDKKQRRMKAVYYGLMSEVDAALGRVIAFLKESGLYDKTLIIFTSDHGEQMGDHWLIGKCGYFDGSYHIPLIIRDPRANNTRGKRIDAFTENVDIMPTMLSAIGAPIPPHCDGAKLDPFLESGRAPATWRTEAHWEYDFRDPADDEAEQSLGLTLHQCTMNIIRSEKYKYVHFTGLPPLFFDLEKDPGERTNRATDPAYMSLVLEYAQKM